MAAHGYGGLAVATMLAGAMLILMGVLRLGKLLKFIPYPVIAGFTTGIAVIIFTAQLNEALGLGLKMPEHVPQQLGALATHLTNVNWQSVGVCAITLTIIYGLPRVTKSIPPSIVAVVMTNVLVAILGYPVATVGSKFGGIPAGWPGWHWPEFSLQIMRDVPRKVFLLERLAKGLESFGSRPLSGSAIKP